MGLGSCPPDTLPIPAPCVTLVHCIAHKKLQTSSPKLDRHCIRAAIFTHCSFIFGIATTRSNGNEVMNKIGLAYFRLGDDTQIFTNTHAQLGK